LRGLMRKAPGFQHTCWIRPYARGWSLIEISMAQALSMAVLSGFLVFWSSHARQEQHTQFSHQHPHRLQELGESFLSIMQNRLSEVPAQWHCSVHLPHTGFRLDAAELRMSSPAGTLVEWRLRDGILQVRLGRNGWQSLNEASQIRVGQAILRPWFPTATPCPQAWMLELQPVASRFGASAPSWKGWLRFTHAPQGSARP
jgi:hypothetical protein